MDTVRSLIRDINDFPKPGIVYKDITPVLNDGKAFRKVINWYASRASALNPDAIVGIDARGFIFGAPVAYNIGTSFIPVRKKGKLPYDTIEHSYTLEYGEASLEMHRDALNGKKRIIIVDDLLATGGTAAAAEKLVTELGGEVVCHLFFIELGFLDGRKSIQGPIESAIHF